jgi:hypothetical protein
LLQEQVDRFDIIYNTERPHQGLPGRITPLQAWETTPKAETPRPRGNLIRPVGWEGIRITRVARNGIVQVRSTRFHVTRLLAGQTVAAAAADGNLNMCHLLQSAGGAWCLGLGERCRVLLADGAGRGERTGL